jgi:biopolymer transport protein ExbB/biopolymer transport protein TolQ
VLLAGLQEYTYQQETTDTGSGDVMLEAALRAIERATAVNLTDMKRGLSGLATIGATAPFVGLFGTVVGIINAFQGIALTGSGGIGAVSAGIAEALVCTAFGLFVAVPAVWAFNYFSTKVEGFNVEMDNSSSELIDFMAKKTAA